jgi:hypothetical protein
MRSKRLLNILNRAVLALSLVIFFTAEVFADVPALVNLQVESEGKYVTLNASLQDGLNNKILEAIDNGIPISIIYTVELRREKAIWADKLIRSNEIRHTIQYDSLKKTYRFSATGKNVKRKVITHKKGSYQKLMETLKNIPIVPIYSLAPDEKYYIRVKAVLETDDASFPSDYLLFVPFNEFKTAWAESSPINVAQPPMEEAHQETDIKGGPPGVLNDVIRSFDK